MKLHLDPVTLVMVETREYALAALAIEDSLRKVTFGEVLVLTDKPERFDSVLAYGHKVRFHEVPDWSTKEGWAQAVWYDLPLLVQTSHMLLIQWDSWVWDTSMWSDEFLNYDFCGAPWWYTDGKNVGNSGFCLKSTALARYIRDRRATYECNTSVEDDLLCRKYRPDLEAAGFVWAPERVANQFAFECVRPSPTSRHFGFHAPHNFNEVLPHDRLVERAQLMLESPYISKTAYMMEAFCKKNPALMQELLAEDQKVKGA